MWRLRNSVGAYQINRPEEKAMAAVLAENAGNAAGTILRLAFQQGLLREEITFLTGGTLRLPRRKGWGLSVFSLTDRCTGVCLRGVKYRLEDAVLTNRVPLGVSNEFAAPEAEISLTQGILMIAQTKK